VTSFLPGREVSRAYAVIVQPDDRIVVGGRSFGEGDYARFIVARYLPDRTLDNSFSIDGVNEHFLQPYYSAVYSLALASDGKVVAAGLDRPRGRRKRAGGGPLQLERRAR
jgi:hypothetical protein